jgi:hypothetical protein
MLLNPLTGSKNDARANFRLGMVYREKARSKSSAWKGSISGRKGSISRRKELECRVESG